MRRTTTTWGISLVVAAFAIAALLVISTGAFAADDAAGARVTYTKDVLPILQESCQDCHRPSGANTAGMIAPMSLMTYEEVRPWAKSIARAVDSRQMPPWHATEATRGVFSNERTLNAEQIATIKTWVGQGAKRGKAADAPAPKAPPQTDGGWSIGVPDLIIEFDKPFFVEDDVRDLYHNVTVELTDEQLPEDRWIKAIEFMPGSEVVHHIIARAALGEGADRAQFGMIGGMAPGTDAHTFPEGYGRLLAKGSKITFAMHYHKEDGPGTGQYDSSKMGFVFQDKPVEHHVRWEGISNRGFEIPAGNADWEVGAARTFSKDMQLIGLMPHMHLRGDKASYTAFYPDGTSENILDVPNYDFNWQTNYMFAEPKLLPAGTRLEISFHFNNSPERAEASGFDSTRAIRTGGPTTDEMMIGFIDITEAAPKTQAELAKSILGTETPGD